ncbi:cytochrome P450 [Amycolatopsis albispora]|uniref:Cytochrome P450 n=1 Tax=Amycolatopsis albispora TaxID=1804986 RepID=A0A344LBC1_9PSEU|nr:cytochrome P450 [Amycolatopsis albispora]AXB45345.1 cytochrome P450 [Amycolatopsis albispora]
MTAATTTQLRTVRYPPGELLLSLHARFGPAIRVGPKFAYLLGPEANQFVFANSHLFSWREAFDLLVPVDGTTALIVSDGDDHRRRRRLVQPALHLRQIDHYLRIMAATADATIDAWRPGQVLDLYQEFRAAIRRSTIQSLFGARLAGAADFFGTELQPLLDLIDRLPQAVDLHRRLRTPLWRRAMAARARVDERIYAEIARARAGESEVDDHALATLVRDGELSDLEVRDQVVSLIAAGYETTSAAMAWALYAVLGDPATRERAAAEIRDVLGERPPDRESLKAMPFLTGIVQETLRLYPPAVVSARKVVEGFEFHGKRFRPGTLLLYSPYVTHRLPGLWEDPLAFRPDRWRDGKAGPHEFLPFGGGPHRCIGATMATTELAVMLARVLARADLRLRPQRMRATSLAAMRPRDGLVAEVGPSQVG